MEEPKANESSQSEKNQLPAAGQNTLAPSGRFSLEPRTVEEAWRFAKLMSQSDLVPKDFRGNPANILLAVELGHEVGLTPMQSIQSVCVINGRPVLWGDAALGVVQRSGFLEWIREEVSETEAKCTVKRKGHPELARVFTVDDARVAGLWEKRGANGQPTPWVTHPKRMLQMRARGFALRDGFADVLKGLRVREEMDDTEDQIGAVVDRIYQKDKIRYARLPAWPHWARKQMNLTDNAILAALQRLEQVELSELKENYWGYLVKLATGEEEEIFNHTHTEAADGATSKT